MKPRTGNPSPLPPPASDNPSAIAPVGRKPCTGAFTCTDLLAVLGVLAVLAALFATGRARAAAGGPAAVCQENVRRLSLAWYLYATDHNGRLVNNFGIPEIERTVAAKTYGNWANNVMSWGTSSTITNAQLTASSKLAPYLGPDPDVFHCPSDTYLGFMQRNAGWTRRARTYSLNSSLGSPFDSPNGNVKVGISEWCPERRQFLTLEAIPQPAQIFSSSENSEFRRLCRALNRTLRRNSAIFDKVVDEVRD